MGASFFDCRLPTMKNDHDNNKQQSKEHLAIIAIRSAGVSNPSHGEDRLQTIGKSEKHRFPLNARPRGLENDATKLDHPSKAIVHSINCSMSSPITKLRFIITLQFNRGSTNSTCFLHSPITNRFMKSLLMITSSLDEYCTFLKWVSPDVYFHASSFKFPRFLSSVSVVKSSKCLLLKIFCIRLWRRSAGNANWRDWCKVPILTVSFQVLSLNWVKMSNEHLIVFFSRDPQTNDWIWFLSQQKNLPVSRVKLTASCYCLKCSSVRFPYSRSHGCQVSRMLQDHDSVQSRTDGRRVRRLLHSIVPTNGRKSPVRWD